MSSDATQSILTVADVLRMFAEREELASRIKALDAQIEFVRNYMGEDRFQEIVGEKAAVLMHPVRRRPNTLRAAILKALEGQEAGLSYDEIRPMLAEELEGYSPNTFFNTVSVMVHRKEIAKIGTRLFSIDAYKAMTPEEIAESEAASGDRVSATHAIMEAVKLAGQGLLPGDIKERVQEAHSHINDSAIYAALSRLVVSQKKLKRDEAGRYSLA